MRGHERRAAGRWCRGPLGLPDRARYWGAIAARLGQQILVRAWNPERKAFTAAVDSGELDASVADRVLRSVLDEHHQALALQLRRQIAEPMMLAHAPDVAAEEERIGLLIVPSMLKESRWPASRDRTCVQAFLEREPLLRRIRAELAVLAA